MRKVKGAMSLRRRALHAMIASIAFLSSTTLALAQNWQPLPHRECNSPLVEGTAPQPSFTLDKKTVQLDPSSIGRVDFSSNNPQSGTFPFDTIAKVLFSPGNGLVVETSTVNSLPRDGAPLISSSHGFVDVKLDPNTSYRVVLFVELQTMASQCDSFVVYAVGDIQTSK